MVTSRSSSVDGSAVAAQLRPLLIDLIALAMNGKQAHWHIRGRNFLAIHEKLDEVVSDARNYADEVAERVVALGADVDGRPQAVAEATGTFPSGFLAEDKVITLTIEQLDTVIDRARAATESLDDIDLASQDIAIEILQTFEKHRWMFAAQTM